MTAVAVLSLLVLTIQAQLRVDSSLYLESDAVVKIKAIKNHGCESYGCWYTAKIEKTLKLSANSPIPDSIDFSGADPSYPYPIAEVLKLGQDSLLYLTHKNIDGKGYWSLTLSSETKRKADSLAKSNKRPATLRKNESKPKKGLR